MDIDKELEKKLKELKIIPTSDDKYLMKLKKPVKFGDDDITELELDEPKAKHMRKMQGDPTVDDILKISADLCHQPDSLIDELCLKDANRLGEFFTAFN